MDPGRFGQAVRVPRAQHPSAAGAGRAGRGVARLPSGAASFRQAGRPSRGALPGPDAGERRGRSLEQHRELPRAGPVARRVGAQSRRGRGPPGVSPAGPGPRWPRLGQREDAGGVRGAADLRTRVPAGRAAGTAAPARRRDARRHRAGDRVALVDRRLRPHARGQSALRRHHGYELRARARHRPLRHRTVRPADAPIGGRRDRGRSRPSAAGAEKRRGRDVVRAASRRDAAVRRRAGRGATPGRRPARRAGRVAAPAGVGGTGAGRSPRAVAPPAGSVAPGAAALVWLGAHVCDRLQRGGRASSTSTTWRCWRRPWQRSPASAR